MNLKNKSNTEETLSATKKMYRLDKQIWKQCFISTFICLLGCSIGTMGVAFYLLNYSWWFVLFISIITGLVSCMVFMVFWEMIIRKRSFRDAIKHSYMMSIVSMLIMILSENLILLYIFPKFSSHHAEMTNWHSYKMMLFAMSFGFLLALPYNYYHLQKTGKICH